MVNGFLQFALATPFSPTIGSNKLSIVKASGTAGIQCYDDLSAIERAVAFQDPASGGTTTYKTSISGIIKVISGGTLTLGLASQFSNTASGTVSAGNGQLYAFFMRKGDV
jgi:hypothetical protein